jgi:hypothetical protein
MEQFIFLLVIGAIAFIKWMLEKSAELREKKKTQERLDRLDGGQALPPIVAPRPKAFPPQLEEAERRLREALGLPVESELPPPRKPLPAPAFRLEEIKAVPAADLEHRTFAPPPPPPIRRAPMCKAAADKAEAVLPSARTGLDELLRSRDGLRKAILAQEILGTPKGLVF